MGDVWLVEDLELSDRVVAKIVSPDATTEQLTLLRRECRNARKLVHTNIVPVYELHRASRGSEAPEACFITMAHVDGADIGVLRGRPVAEVLTALIAVADALAYAHGQGIVHRDVKTSNVLIDEAGAPRVLDFGISGRVARAGQRSDVETDISFKGGGSEGFASPQQLAGYPPCESDDIYAFAALARDLLSGQRLPVELDGLLTAALNRDPRHRPQSMADVKRALETTRGELASTSSPPTENVAPQGRIKLVPPPRASRVEAIPPAVVRTASPSSVRSRSPGGVGAKTIAAFLLLLAFAGGVFFVLPRWVEESKLAVSPEASPKVSGDDTIGPEDALDVPVLEDLAQEMARAGKIRERALELRASLDSRNVGAWGGDAYRDAVAALSAGDEQMGRRAFAEAATTFQNALTRLESVHADANRVASEALRRGNSALVAGSATEAEDAFNLAASIRPGDAEAVRGLARAKVLDELRLLVARGEELFARGDLEGSADAFRKAASLDPHSAEAQRGLARVDSKASEQAFTRAMSDAVAALNRSDYEAARGGFERARAIRPTASDVADGLKAVEDAQRLQRIAEHRDQAEQLEGREAWRAAEREYQAVLDIDDTIRFAREGKTRTSTRAALSEKLEFHIDNPQRLSDAVVLNEASQVLNDAQAVAGAGPELQRQIARLTDIVADFSTPVEVRLLSDGQTEVVVFKVGAIGKFDSHALVLRPGTYTVVGRRQGYRDVRHQLVVDADAPPEPLMVRCEEEI
jgi:tetratricopeptide (TPR) repeat protein